MKAISVIIPCYNVDAYLDRCLTSVVSQTIGTENLEIICIDDASSDGTWERLKVWERQYPDHILLIRQETNRRQGAARNIGLTYASADWVAFVDADDWLEPDYLEQLYKPAMEYPCDVVCCGEVRDFSDTLSYLDEKTREAGQDRYIVTETEEARKYMITSLAGGEAVWGKLVRRKTLLEAQIYFPEELVYEDMYWHTMLHIYASGFYVVNKKLYHYFANYQSTALSMNETWHMDWLTVQVEKWAEYRRRGLLERYREELEFDCLRDAVGFLKLIVLRYEEPPFSFFQLGRTLIRGMVPDYRANPYLVHFTDFYRVLLEALYVPVGRTEFEEIARQARRYWGER